MDANESGPLVSNTVGSPATPPLATQDPRFAVPSTVSVEAARRLQFIYDFLKTAPTPVKPASLEDWDRIRFESEEFAVQLGRATVDALRPVVVAETLGGVPVFRVRPAEWTSGGRMHLYLHGGGYVTGGGRGSIAEVSVMAAATGDEVVAVDYTKAPRGRWKEVTGEVLAVWRALLEADADPQTVGVYGSSAGGGLAAGSILKMRDAGLPLPAALYLQAPWSDITATGDTITTLASADPLLTSESLAWGAEAYADPEDQRHPYVSPVYGDYSKPFPPTLIQVGTREIFLSHAVRLYQAIRSGGHLAVLDIYEGMPHGFPSLFTETPEGRTAIGRAASFFEAHLGAAAG